jgi:hypothetical protein
MDAMSTGQFAALSTSQIRAFSAADLATLSTTSLVALSTGQIAALSTTQIDGLTTTQIVALETSDVRALTTAQISSLGTEALDALTTTQIGALTTGQIARLTTTQVAALDTDDLAALTTAQIRALTTAQIVALQTSQIEGLETADLAAMTTAQAHAFEAADIQAMSTSQINALMSATPIVLDLDANGVQTLAAADGVHFDVAGTGQASRFGWVGGADGLLARDLDGNGSIDNGRELFGAGTQLADGQRAGNGFVALAAEDTNHDGVVNASDANFGQLQVWVDANHDGKTDAGELKGLVELGITGLNLAPETSDRVDNGNAVGLVSSYTTADGQSHEMADVWFSREAEAAPALGDLLSAPSGELLGGDGGGGGGVSAAAIAPPRTGLDDELLRNGQPLL